MKKTLVAALTSAMVIGAASTTFAAANPFSDVPMDHWAYDAVSQLAADGVIEGYGDTTFRGQQNITRYEMAQMIAKAMAKTNVSGADQALINKLAAEFADELNNLGVRVSNLERNADMVKWNGKVEYTYTSTRDDRVAKDNKDNDDNLLFRLEPSAEVNDHWHVNARIDANTKMDLDAASKAEENDKATLKRAWAQGDYKNFTVKLGKQELYTNEGEGQFGGLLFDDEFSGAAVTFGNDLKATVLAGRLNNYYDDDFKDTASLQGIDLQYAPNKLSVGAGYYHLNTYDLTGLNGYGDSDDANIWSVNAGYNFDGTSKLVGAYAQNTEADNYDHSWQAEYDYKGAQAANKGTWGAWAGYRYLGYNTSLLATTDEALVGTKGWVVGANYTLYKNIVASAKYFNGEDLANSDNDVEKLFGRVEFLF